MNIKILTLSFILLFSLNEDEFAQTIINFINKNYKVKVKNINELNEFLQKNWINHDIRINSTHNKSDFDNIPESNWLELIKQLNNIIKEHTPNNSVKEDFIVVLGSTLLDMQKRVNKAIQYKKNKNIKIIVLTSDRKITNSEKKSLKNINASNFTEYDCANYILNNINEDNVYIINTTFNEVTPIERQTRVSTRNTVEKFLKAYKVNKVNITFVSTNPFQYYQLISILESFKKLNINAKVYIIYADNKIKVKFLKDAIARSIYTLITKL